MGSGQLFHICEVAKMPWKAEKNAFGALLRMWAVGETSQVPYPGTDLGCNSMKQLDLWLWFCRQDSASFKYLLGFFNLNDEIFVEFL